MRADCLPKRSSGSGGGSASGGGGVHPKGGGVALGRVALVLSDHFGTGYQVPFTCALSVVRTSCTPLVVLGVCVCSVGAQCLGFGGYMLSRIILHILVGTNVPPNENLIITCTFVVVPTCNR